MIDERKHAYPQLGMVETFLLANESGVLEELEICTAGDGYIADPRGVFVEAHRTNSFSLIYRSEAQRS